LVFVEETKFPFATPYFSCLDTRKVTAAAAAKESQEILIGVATHLACGSNSRISEKQIQTFLFFMTYKI